MVGMLRLRYVLFFLSWVLEAKEEGVIRSDKEKMGIREGMGSELGEGC